MVASSLEALRALLGGRAGALASTASVFVIDDMSMSNWVMSGSMSVVVVQVLAELGGKLGVYENLFGAVRPL